MELFKESPEFIVLHCTDSEPKQSITVDWIRQWHFARGFEDIGYHFVIMPDGTICQGRSLEYVGAHCLGLNRRSFGVAYVGGRIGCTNRDTRTRLQKLSICQVVVNLIWSYPSIQFLVGHNEYSKKCCPCFDVHQELGQWFEDVKREIRLLTPNTK